MLKNNAKRIIFPCLLPLFICGCATWTKTNGQYSNNSAMYQVDLPWGWLKHAGETLLVTKDGIFLEGIEIARINVNKKLTHTKKKFVKGMLAEDIAAVAIDDLSTNSEINNLEILENGPVIISGQNGFRLAYLFRNKDGLKYKRVHYGFEYEDWVYRLTYTSAADYYFDKNVEEFNKVIESFKFLPRRK